MQNGETAADDPFINPSEYPSNWESASSLKERRKKNEMKTLNWATDWPVVSKASTVRVEKWEKSKARGGMK